MKTFYILIPFIFFHFNILSASNGAEGTLIKANSEFNWMGDKTLVPVTPLEVDLCEMAPEPAFLLKNLIPVIPDEFILVGEEEINPEILLKDLSPVVPAGIEEGETIFPEEPLNLISIIPLYPDNTVQS